MEYDETFFFQNPDEVIDLLDSTKNGKISV